ncbi:MAG: excinuclease ABC subunit UvrC [Alphaproteobacteria bacterium]
MTPSPGNPDLTEEDLPSDNGRAVIRAALRSMPSVPGVYRMLNRRGEVLYVGKARNLKRRVGSYANRTGHTNRILNMIAATASMEIVTTHTEVEALLLESNLIKRLKPRFNVTLRDDKSFPYIMIRRDHAWAQIAKHRGPRDRDAEYFGPFASAGAVNRTLSALQRAFPLRSCSDSIFESRTRPCLQYQIKRCTAPCVGRIEKHPYEEIVQQAREFLTGKSHEIQQRLAALMTTAAETRDYETAAMYRDRIRALAHIQARQGINVQTVDEADVIALHQEGSQVCVQVFFFRSGQNFGSRAYYPVHAQSLEPPEILTAFLGQFYESRPAPRLILVSHDCGERALVEEALSVRAGHSVKINKPQRGEKADLVRHALDNADDALRRRMAESATQRALLEGIAETFGLENAPDRIEVYDNSHVSGTHAVGAMIVAGPDGFMKNHYRKFNIRDTEISPGDDYGMMREVLTRRFKRLLKDDDEARALWPGLVLIDGGQGQLGVAKDVLADLGLSEIPLAGVAKGPDRNAGRERLFLADGTVKRLEPRDPVLYFIQRLRDEAHRFAIGSHRARRSKAIGTSPLDEIPGIGARRKRALLHHFGSAGEVARAGLHDLEKVEGISGNVAKVVYGFFHSET